METDHSIADLRARVAGWRAMGETIALVPTMGALHAGHLALVASARQLARRVIVSIFVNPTQFAANEDLSRYPRQPEADARLLAGAGADLLFLPDAHVIYPAGFATRVQVAGVSQPLEGAFRPGHFDGVATVVLKLLLMAAPDTAIFGEKDWQQLAVIRRMTADLNLPVAIVGAPIVREEDGLALSSRNAYLSADERRAAAALPAALHDAAAAIIAGAPAAEAIATATARLEGAGFVLDYLALADARTLGPPQAGQPQRLLVAARIGATRLIDNLPAGNAR